MVEAGAQHASEEEVLEAIEYGHACCKKIAAGIRRIGQPRPARRNGSTTPPAVNKALYASIESADPQGADRRARYQEVSQARKLPSRSRSQEEGGGSASRRRASRSRKSCSTALKERIFRDEMLKAKRRPDGRAFDEIRNIDCEVGVLPRTHGSALFTRGETQALVTVTLGTKDDEQRIEMFDLSRNLQALHAALQLPAVQRRRSGIHARSGTPRNRTWRAGGTIRSRPSFPTTRSSPTPCAWSATSWNPMVPAPWPACAAERSR